jgi:hypothetical protein
MRNPSDGVGIEVVLILLLLFAYFAVMLTYFNAW